MTRYVPYAGSNREEAVRRKRDPQLSHNIELREAVRGVRAATRHWWETVSQMEGASVDLAESVGVSVDVIDSLVWQLVTLLAVNLSNIGAMEGMKHLGELQLPKEGSPCTLDARAAWVAKAITACRNAAEESFPTHGTS